MTNRPLLDEQYLLAWGHAAGGINEPLSSFIDYRGFQPVDLWGPFATALLKLSCLFFTCWIWLWRAQGILLHTAATWLVYEIVDRLTGERAWALVCACLFCLNPLNPEAVLWIGGRPNEVAVVLFLLSFFAYQRASTNWRWLMASVVSFGCALLSSASIWPLCTLFGIYEVIDRVAFKKPREGDQTLAVVAPLGFFVLTAAYFAGRGLLSDLGGIAQPDLRLGQIWHYLRGAFLPLNPAVVPHLSRHALFFVAVLTPALLVLPWAAYKNARLRFLLFFASVWFLLADFPVSGYFGSTKTAVGSHLIYDAQPAIAMLITAAVVSYSVVFGEKFVVAKCLSVASFLALAIFLAAHCRQQNIAYRRGGRLASSLAQQVRSLRSASPIVMISDPPAEISLIAAYSSSQILLFDPGTALVAANAVSAGRLRDELLRGKYVHDVFRWDVRSEHLVPVDFSQTATPPLDLDATAIASRLVPPLSFFPSISLDKNADRLTVRSTDEGSPALRVSADGLSALGSDVLFVDAEISDAGKDRHWQSAAGVPKIEAYWTTAQQTDYDHEKRRVWTPAFASGNGFRRYYLPLRTIGWLTSERPQLLTIGFPKDSQIRLKAIGTVSSEALMPQFNVLPSAYPPQNAFEPPFYKFPQIEALGFARYGAWSSRIATHHDCRALSGAQGAMIEISMPNKRFANTNGRQASGVGAAVLGANSVSGNDDIPMTYFPICALYSLRAAAQDKGHNPISCFSDDAYCLISRPRGGFSLQ